MDDLRRVIGARAGRNGEGITLRAVFHATK
jgi:hypothetical protein